MVFTNGDKYEGEWHRDEIQGRWVHTMPDGARYEGEWKSDQMEGHGVFTKPWIMKSDEIKDEHLLDRAPDDLRKGWKAWIAEHGSGRDGAGAAAVIPEAGIISVYRE